MVKEPLKDGPTEILSVSGWYMTHGYNWTDTYGAFRNDNGKVVTDLGRAMSVQERSYVVGHMLYVKNLVESPQMLTDVKSQAQDLGYDFNENLKLYANLNKQSPQEKGKAAQKKPVNVNLELKKRLKSLQQLPSIGQNRDYEKIQAGAR